MDHCSAYTGLAIIYTSNAKMSAAACYVLLLQLAILTPPTTNSYSLIYYISQNDQIERYDSLALNNSAADQKPRDSSYFHPHKKSPKDSL